jgi:hypothetical protein
MRTVRQLGCDAPGGGHPATRHRHGYDNIIIRKKASGNDVDTFHMADSPGGAFPSGTSAAQQTITATIERSTRPPAHLSGPRGWTYLLVQDRKALDQVSAGDRATPGPKPSGVGGAAKK